METPWWAAGSLRKETLKTMKKRKKRRAPPSASERRQHALADMEDRRERKARRMNPIARNLLFGNLVFLAVTQLLYSGGYISDMLSGSATLLGICLLLLALWFQFGGKGHTGGTGHWPGL